MASKSPAELIAEINQNLPSNDSGAITAAKLRTVLIDIVDSSYNNTELIPAEDLDGVVDTSSDQSIGGVKTITGAFVPPGRTVTAAGAVTVANDDYLVIIAKTIPEATTVTLPASGGKNGAVIIADGSGDASSHNITITPHAGDTIIGQSSITIASDYGTLCLRPKGAGNGWIIT